MLWTELSRPCAEPALELSHGVVVLGTVGPLPFPCLAFFTAHFMASPSKGCGPWLPGLHLVLEGGLRLEGARQPRSHLETCGTTNYGILGDA